MTLSILAYKLGLAYHYNSTGFLLHLKIGLYCLLNFICTIWNLPDIIAFSWCIDFFFKRFTYTQLPLFRAHWVLPWWWVNCINLLQLIQRIFSTKVRFLPPLTVLQMKIRDEKVNRLQTDRPPRQTAIKY